MVILNATLEAFSWYRIYTLFCHRELIVDFSVQTAGYYPNALGHALKRHYYKSNQRDDLGFCGLQWHH